MTSRSKQSWRPVRRFSTADWVDKELALASEPQYTVGQATVAWAAGAGTAPAAGATTSMAAAIVPKRIPIFFWRIWITGFLGLRRAAAGTAGESTKGLGNLRGNGKKELESLRDASAIWLRNARSRRLEQGCAQHLLSAM